MPWACERCREIHTRNPSECRNCGHRIFDPIDPETVDQRSAGISSPEKATVDADQVMGATPEPGYESSPDVAVDGSVENSAEYDQEHTQAPESQRRFSGIVNSLRATLLASIGLLRRYLVPLLAFALVFGAVLYLLVSL